MRRADRRCDGGPGPVRGCGRDGAPRPSPRTEEDSLRQFFARFGRIAKIRLVRDKGAALGAVGKAAVTPALPRPVTGESRRYAFIEYARERDAELAFHRGHEATIDDARVRGLRATVPTSPIAPTLTHACWVICAGCR